MIRVIIADDHAIVRQGLRQVVADSHDIEIVGEASNGHEALDRVRSLECDVAVLDIGMPGKDGLDALKEIKAAKPRLPVLILSMYPEEQYAVRLLKAGAAGYLTKESAPEELVSAIRRVARGGRYISQGLAEQLAFLVSAGDGLPHERLSDREHQVMLLMAAGRTASEVAEAMCLSVKTVSTYRVRALEKMGMRTNAEFAFYAIKHGLLG